MRRYETVFIIQTDLPDEDLSNLVDRYAAIVTDRKGVLIKLERWGKRKLAYEIKKQNRGFYVVIDYVGVGSMVDELERNFKIDDKVLKYMTIVKADHVDLEAIEKEIAAGNEKADDAAIAPSAPEAAKPQETTQEKE